jgi:hypothetical protein
MIRKWNWAVILSYPVGWAALGLGTRLPYMGNFITAWYKWMIGALFLTEIGWISQYTLMGFLGKGKWWRSDMGVNLVGFIIISLVGVFAPLTYAQFFHQGRLDQSFPVWWYLGGVTAQPLWFLWRLQIWRGTYQRGEEERKEPA